jgi:hypothetical protein
LPGRCSHRCSYPSKACKSRGAYLARRPPHCEPENGPWEHVPCAASPPDQLFRCGWPVSSEMPAELAESLPVRSNEVPITSVIMDDLDPVDSAFVVTVLSRPVGSGGHP